MFAGKTVRAGAGDSRVRPLGYLVCYTAVFSVTTLKTAV